MLDESLIVETPNFKIKYRSAEYLRAAVNPVPIDSVQNYFESCGKCLTSNMMLLADVVYDKSQSKFIKHHTIGSDSANKITEFTKGL